MPHLSELRYPTPLVRERGYMNSASAKSSESGSPKSDPIPIVFVVDDDISVRESLEALIRFVGWEPETFASAEEFLLAHVRLRRAVWYLTFLFRSSTVLNCRS
jgi:hypothetical protein